MLEPQACSSAVFVSGCVYSRACRSSWCASHRSYTPGANYYCIEALVFLTVGLKGLRKYFLYSLLMTIRKVGITIGLCVLRKKGGNLLLWVIRRLFLLFIVHVVHPFIFYLATIGVYLATIGVFEFQAPW